MKIPNEDWVGIRDTLIVDEVLPIQEPCVDCPVANTQYTTAAQLQQLTGYVFDVVAGISTSQKIREIIEPDEKLDSAFREWLHEFFPGIGAMEKSTVDNLRFVNDLSEGTAEWFIKHANRKIQAYEKLTEGCANQGLKKIVLDQSKDQAAVELTVCSGEIEGARDSKKNKEHPIRAIAKRLEFKQ